VFGDGENVAVGIFEPGDFGCSVGRAPDAIWVLLEEGVALEGDSGCGELLHGGCDRRNFPAKDGVRGWIEGLHARDADVGGV